MAQADHVTTAIRTLNTEAFPTFSPFRVLAAHAEFLATLAAYPPEPIPIGVRAADIEAQADHLDTVFSALSAYMGTILEGTAQNVRGRLVLRDAKAILADLASDVTGAVQREADEMAGRLA